jgi:hypothetical protein
LFGIADFLLFFFLGFSGSTKSVTSGHYYIPSGLSINLFSSIIAGLSTYLFFFLVSLFT